MHHWMARDNIELARRRGCRCRGNGSRSGCRGTSCDSVDFRRELVMCEPALLSSVVEVRFAINLALRSRLGIASLLLIGGSAEQLLVFLAFLSFAAWSGSVCTWLSASQGTFVLLACIPKGFLVGFDMCRINSLIALSDWVWAATVKTFNIAHASKYTFGAFGAHPVPL